MRVAFYAPMKPSSHPEPSGDRRMARLLIEALAMGGHAVEQACGFRSFDGGGDPARQRRLAEIGGRIATGLVRRYARRPVARRPQVWFTYHLYHKAPDWLGPTVSRALAIPYVVAEASHAPKQQRGAWADGYRAAERAIAGADRVIGLNSADAECVLPLLADRRRLVRLRPFIDTAPYLAAANARQRHRQQLIDRLGTETTTPLLLTVAMMRRGDKFASYRALARSLARLSSRPWRLIVVGDGPARGEVEHAFAALQDRVTWLGRLDGEALAAVYAAADLYVWPAVGEAYGMAFLEAQAAGLPVVAGNTGGVADVVGDGETGILVGIGDDVAFAAAVAALLDDPPSRRAMARRSLAKTASEHDITAASRLLHTTLDSLGCRREAGR